MHFRSRTQTMAGFVALFLLALAQPKVSAQQVQQATNEEAPPLTPAQSPGPLTLEACLDLGMQHQASLDAARASLAAAQTGSRALNRLIIPRLLVPDLAVRRDQACLGVDIASAKLTQAEQETRYAIMRNYFTVQYVNMQRIVVDDTLRSLDSSRKKAQKIYDAGDPKNKITKIDLDFLDVNLAQVKNKKSQVEAGMLKAMAALREAMGVNYDYPLEIAATGLPPAVYLVEVQTGKKDEKGKAVTEKKYYRVYSLDKKQLIESALANRSEITQAATASQVVNLEIEAQRRIRGWKGGTFAQGADLHVDPVPLMIANGNYRPGAIAPEMPTLLAGRKQDRMARASDFAARASAVVDKTTNLVALDTEDQYLKWLEATEDIEELSAIVDLANGLPKKAQDLDPQDFTANAVIQANITAISVRAQLNEARHNHALALAGLERATAGAFQVFPVPAPAVK